MGLKNRPWRFGLPGLDSNRSDCNLFKYNCGINKGDRPDGHKGYIKDCFIFDSWLSSKKLSEAAMDVGSDMIDMVKTKTKVFCK